MQLGGLEVEGPAEFASRVDDQAVQVRPGREGEGEIPLLAGQSGADDVLEVDVGVASRAPGLDVDALLVDLDGSSVTQELRCQ